MITRYLTLTEAQFVLKIKFNIIQTSLDQTLPSWAIVVSLVQPIKENNVITNHRRAFDILDSAAFTWTWVGLSQA